MIDAPNGEGGGLRKEPLANPPRHPTQELPEIPCPFEKKFNSNCKYCLRYEAQIRTFKVLVATGWHGRDDCPLREALEKISTLQVENANLRSTWHARDECTTKGSGLTKIAAMKYAEQEGWLSPDNVKKKLKRLREIKETQSIYEDVTWEEVFAVFSVVEK